MKFSASLVTVSLSVVGSLALVGCADQREPDELAADSEDLGLAGDDKADAAPGTYTFFRVEQDDRRCMAPYCGGKQLSRLNRSTTICHTGRSGERCYVPELDYSATGISPAQVDALGERPIIVRGRFAAKSYGGENLGTFLVSEVWQSISDATGEGVFMKLRDSGARCISAPCFNKTEKALNSSNQATVSEIDWSNIDASAEVIDAAVHATFTEDVIVSGWRYRYRQNGTIGRGREAMSAYRLVKPAAAECFVGGCSSQLCSDQPGMISTCEWREEYACYRAAACERQPDGACGWTPTAELTACLADN